MTAEEIAVTLGGENVEREVKRPDDQVRDGEEDAVLVKRLRDRESDDEHRTHRCEHRDPDRPLLGIQGVRQPGICRPRPPKRAEHEHPAEHAAPRRVVRKQAGDLRDREDEYEVEEELERCDPLLVLGGSSLHGWKLSPSAGYPRSMGRPRADHSLHEPG